MSITGQRLVQNPAGEVQVEEYTVPDPAPNQILVAVTVSQVSAGSEMNGVRRRRNASAEERSQFQTTPMGYTAVGCVQAVGSEITNFAVGDRVLCGGSHATHWLVTPSKVNNLVAGFRDYMIEKIPDHVTDAEAAFAILGDVALHGVRKAALQIGESVAVHGLGVIGNLAVQLCRLSGAYPVIGVDLVEERLALAQELGATHTIHAGEQDVVAVIRELTEIPWRWRGALANMPPGNGAEVQLHCSSNIGIYPTLLKAAADRGRVVLVGATSGSVPIESNELFRREIKVMGSYQTGMAEPHPYWPWSRVRNYHTIMAMIGRGELRVKSLISHIVPYTEAPALYDLMMSGGQGWMSILFKWA
jgi:threonine dehydrogenase-like Zn-dependent dehydrogenase